MGGASALCRSAAGRERGPARAMASASAPQKAAAPAGGRDNMPWVEKYRPSLVRDIVGNAEAVSRLEIIAADGNMPNMIFAGPPGTGKTTSVLCLANALLGSAAKEAVLELNASDDRGIDVVRNKIKMFAQKKVTLPPGRHKIVILDEADSMTTGAQQALRRTMEIYSQTTRFALACNLSTKIIEPIQSRCAVIRFTKLSDAEVLERLKFVVQEENVPHVDEGLEAIIFSADGDMRQALNNVQATHSGFSFVNAANVYKVGPFMRAIRPFHASSCLALFAACGGALARARVLAALTRTRTPPLRRCATSRTRPPCASACRRAWTATPTRRSTRCTRCGRRGTRRSTWWARSSAWVRALLPGCALVCVLGRACWRA